MVRHINDIPQYKRLAFKRIAFQVSATCAEIFARFFFLASKASHKSGTIGWMGEGGGNPDPNLGNLVIAAFLFKNGGAA
jgi:hypothetical protein